VVQIGDLELPADLQQAIGEGRWKPPEDSSIVANVFGDEPDLVEFYDVEAMRTQNRVFQTKSQDDIAEEVPGSEGGVGCDPSLAVIIGSLGADMPIVLDYRHDQVRPRVIYLGPEGWRQIATDFEALSRALGI
jgi:hypothetical protein